MDLKQLHQLKCELLKVYRYQGLTLQELLCEFYSHINEVINSTNGLIDIVDYLVGEGLSNEVASHLNQMLIDGTFDKIISNKVDELSTNLNNQFNEMKKIIESNISESNNLIENLKIYDSRFNNIENKNIEQDTRIKEVENKNKVQDVYINGLFNENKDGRLSIEGEGNDLKLEGSKQGLVEVDKVVGNTLVNLIQRSWVTNNNYMKYIIVDNLKVNTDYTLIAPATSTNRFGVFDSTGAIALNPYSSDIIITFNTGSRSSIRIYITAYNEDGSTNSSGTINVDYTKTILLEGDYTNKPIPTQHIEGLQSSFEENLVTQEMINEGLESAENLGKYKVPVKVVGKNLFTDINSVVGFLSTGTIVSNTTLSKTTDYIKVQYNTNYTIHCDNGDSYLRHIEFYDSDKNYLNDYVSYKADTTKTFRTPYFNVKYIRISYDINATNIQLEEGTVVTDYEDYFERTTNVYLNSPLLEGDEIVMKDGELCHYHKMSKETITGNNVRRSVTIDNSIYRWVVWENPLIGNLTGGKLLINDKYPSVLPVDTWGSSFKDGLTQNSANNLIILYLDKYKDGSDSSKTSLIEELNANPINVVYYLAEPYYEPISTDKLLLECANDSTIHIESIVPVKSVSASYTTGIPNAYLLQETGITNTEDISVTQTAVDFLLMSSMGESLMISFLNNVKGINNLGTYFASRIIKKALSYTDVINKYPQFKKDIDTILLNEGYEYLIK